MNQQVTTFIIGQSLMLISVCIGAYLKIMTRLKEFEIRIKHIEKQDATIMHKLDVIESTLTEIKVSIAEVCHK